MENKFKRVTYFDILNGDCALAASFQYGEGKLTGKLSQTNAENPFLLSSSPFDISRKISFHRIYSKVEVKSLTQWTSQLGEFRLAGFMVLGWLEADLTVRSSFFNDFQSSESKFHEFLVFSDFLCATTADNPSSCLLGKNRYKPRPIFTIPRLWGGC